MNKEDSKLKGHVQSIAWHLCMILTDDNIDKTKKKYEELMK